MRGNGNCAGWRRVRVTYAESVLRALPQTPSRGSAPAPRRASRPRAPGALRVSPRNGGYAKRNGRCRELQFPARVQRQRLWWGLGQRSRNDLRRCDIRPLETGRLTGPADGARLDLWIEVQMNDRTTRLSDDTLGLLACPVCRTPPPAEGDRLVCADPACGRESPW